MKILSSMNFNFFLIMTLFILSGCSDTFENNDYKLESSVRDDNPIGCDVLPNTTSFLVEFGNHITREERNLVRESLKPGYLVCAQLDVCSTNQNIELWIVKGNKNFKPLAATPNNPELKTAFANCPN